MKLWTASDANNEDGDVATGSKREMMRFLKDSRGSWSVCYEDLGKIDRAKIIDLRQGTGFVEQTLVEFDWDDGVITNYVDHRKEKV